MKNFKTLFLNELKLAISYSHLKWSTIEKIKLYYLNFQMLGIKQTIKLCIGMLNVRISADLLKHFNQQAHFSFKYVSSPAFCFSISKRNLLNLKFGLKVLLFFCILKEFNIWNILSLLEFSLDLLVSIIKS